jgi:hypothetical protein
VSISRRHDHVGKGEKTQRGSADLDFQRVGSSIKVLRDGTPVNRALVEGVARVSDEHAGDLHQMVEVVKR